MRKWFKWDGVVVGLAFGVVFDLGGAWFNFYNALNTKLTWMAPINMMVGVLMLFFLQENLRQYVRHRKLMQTLDRAAQRTFTLRHRAMHS